MIMIIVLILQNIQKTMAEWNRGTSFSYNKMKGA